MNRREDSISEDHIEVEENAIRPRRKEKSIKMIDLQNTDGSFKKDILLGKLAGKTLDEIDLEADRIGVARDVWITAIALAIIETKYKDEKDCLELIIEKAVEWISNSGKNEYDLLEMATGFVGFLN